jgi:hypothetical protein
MTTPPLDGPRWRPTAYPLLDLARKAVHGHQLIAGRVAEWAAEHHDAVAAERAARHDQIAAEPPAAEYGS